MHKWESTEKLLSDWERQEVGRDFDYLDFDYQKDEFDNVPPVVPRFLFYLQLNIKPITKQLRAEAVLQKTSDLRQECLNWVNEARQAAE